MASIWNFPSHSWPGTGQHFSIILAATVAQNQNKSYGVDCVTFLTVQYLTKLIQLRIIQNYHLKLLFEITGQYHTCISLTFSSALMDPVKRSTILQALLILQK